MADLDLKFLDPVTGESVDATVPDDILVRELAQLAASQLNLAPSPSGYKLTPKRTMEPLPGEQALSKVALMSGDVLRVEGEIVPGGR